MPRLSRRCISSVQMLWCFILSCLFSALQTGFCVLVFFFGFCPFRTVLRLLFVQLDHLLLTRCRFDFSCTGSTFMSLFSDEPWQRFLSFLSENSLWRRLQTFNSYQAFFIHGRGVVGWSFSVAIHSLSNAWCFFVCVILSWYITSSSALGFFSFPWPMFWMNTAKWQQTSPSHDLFHDETNEKNKKLFFTFIGFWPSKIGTNDHWKQRDTHRADTREHRFLFLFHSFAFFKGQLYKTDWTLISFVMFGPLVLFSHFLFRNSPHTLGYAATKSIFPLSSLLQSTDYTF